MKTLLTIARKDISVLFRDKAALLVLIAMPFALIFILGSALGNLETGDFGIKVAIVNDDGGDIGEHFVTGITGAKEITSLFDIAVLKDADAVRRDVERGNLTAALLIPADTSERVSRGEPVTLEVLQDPGSPLAGGIWVGVVKAAVSYASADLVYGRAMLGALAASSGQPPSADAIKQLGSVDLSLVTVTNSKATIKKQIPMMSYYAAGMTAMFLLFGSMFGAFAFVRERREQTLARILVTPANRVQIVGGKGLAILVVGLAQLVLLVFGTRLLFHVEWGQHVEAILLLGAAEAVAAAGMAMTLAALGKNERAIGGIGPALIMLFAATGGSMLPADQLPAWLKPAQVISPTYWTLGGFLDVMRGAGVAEVAGRAGIVLLIALVLYAFGVWRLSYE